MVHLEEAAATVYGVSRSLSTVIIITQHFRFVKNIFYLQVELEIVYTLIAYQEFESLSLRQQKTRMVSSGSFVISGDFYAVSWHQDRHSAWKHSGENRYQE